MESPVENLSFYKISKNAKALSCEITFKQPIGETIGVNFLYIIKLILQLFN